MADAKVGPCSPNGLWKAATGKSWWACVLFKKDFDKCCSNGQSSLRGFGMAETTGQGGTPLSRLTNSNPLLWFCENCECKASWLTTVQFMFMYICVQVKQPGVFEFKRISSVLNSTSSAYIFWHQEFFFFSWRNRSSSWWGTWETQVSEQQVDFKFKANLTKHVWVRRRN